MRAWIEAVKLHSASHTAATGLARHGIVTSVDPVNHAIKVSVEPDGVESGWIPDAAVAAGGLKISCPSEVGTQVLLLPVEGDAEQPVVIARLFDTVETVPVSPATSQPVQPGEIGIFLKSGPFLHLTPSGIYLGGDVMVSGTVKVTGDVVAAGISLDHHVHLDVKAGSDVSGAPRS
ncbi:phage baseplate assembly protein V [Lichenicoccus sp.]|uniref:phage baseplate assembly protein V n=1 Tax=Lichenicoccus sp. TaxID=2781899 RepID=UPI003D0C9E23